MVGRRASFLHMDGKTTEIQNEDCRSKCLLMSSGKGQKLMRRTHKSRGRNAEFYMINVKPSVEQASEFHTREVDSKTT
jgi:hypothetical protein